MRVSAPQLVVLGPFEPVSTTAAQTRTEIQCSSSRLMKSAAALAVRQMALGQSASELGAILGSGVNCPVAVGAQGDEVFRGIITLSAPSLHMMDLQFGERAADLASPAISVQNLVA
jgi:hypothetical protein